MADGGYIFDEELSPEFNEREKYDNYQLLGSNEEAFALTVKNFKITDEELQRIIDKYEINETG